MSEWWLFSGSVEDVYHMVTRPTLYLCNSSQCVNTLAALQEENGDDDGQTMLGNGINDNWITHLTANNAGTEASPTASSVIDLSFTTWAALITILLLLFTALGNTLVCIAIAWDKRLQNMTNYFLMSLAVTDFMVALLVMPFGILVIIKGTFPLSSAYCVVWITLDVLFCTCSILHLCTLSVDRYLSLRYPIKYGRNKTKRRVVLKICLVWMTSVAMSVPLCLMYSREDQEVIKDGICAIQDPLYMTVGSIISFYIPLLIMLVTHALTLRLLKEAEKTKTITVISNECASAHSMAGTSTALVSGTESPYPYRQPSCSWKRFLSKTYSNVSTSTDADTSDTPSMMEMQRLTTPEDTPTRRLSQRNRIKETQPVDDIPAQNQVHLQLLPYIPRIKEDQRSVAKDADDSSSEEVWVEVAIDSAGRTNSMAIKPAERSHNHVAQTNPGPHRGGRYALCCISGAEDGELPSFQTTAVNGNHQTNVTGGSLHQARLTGWQETTSPPRLSQGSDESPRLCELTIPMRTCLSRTTSIRRSRQGRFIQSERKATKVLGIIFFTFVILWAPFFSLNIVCGLCPSCAERVSSTISYLVLWLGYASSTVNPVFYTIFNPTFRQTFVRILKCQWK